MTIPVELRRAVKAWVDDNQGQACTMNNGRKELCDLVRFHMEKHRGKTNNELRRIVTGMVRKAREKPEAGSSTRKDAVPEKSLPLYSDVMGEWMTRWVDERIPALSGKTPREAVQSPEGREKVEEILKNWENIEERKGRDGEPYMDVSAVRKMLNL